MENAEEILHFLEEFTKRKPKTIPQELNDYLAFVARTGDPVYQWSLVKALFKEKLLNVITDFYETTPGLDIPPYPNVDPFNYDIMKNSLLERLDSFAAAPFTVQRICELLTYPRKQYNRIDKFMRAIEKNILVVSTREPGPQRQIELENGDSLDPIVNGADNNSDYSADVDMEDISLTLGRRIGDWKTEPQPSSSDTHISVDDIEARLQAKQNTSEDGPDKSEVNRYESVTPPELNVSDDPVPEVKTEDPLSLDSKTLTEEVKPVESATTGSSAEPKMEVETQSAESAKTPLVIPEITVDDAEMTEQKLSKQASLESEPPIEEAQENKPVVTEAVSTKANDDKVIEAVAPPLQSMDDSSLDSTKEEINETKHASEVTTSSEESSSSSDNTDGNSNSPKPDIEPLIDVQDESNTSEALSCEPISSEEVSNESKDSVVEEAISETSPEIKAEEKQPDSCLAKPDDYSISDVNSQITVPPSEIPNTTNEPGKAELEIKDIEIPVVEAKVEEAETETKLEPQEVAKEES